MPIAVIALACVLKSSILIRKGRDSLLSSVLLIFFFLFYIMLKIYCCFMERCFKFKDGSSDSSSSGIAYYSSSWKPFSSCSLIKLPSVDNFLCSTRISLLKSSLLLIFFALYYGSSDTLFTSSSWWWGLAYYYGHLPVIFFAPSFYLSWSS